MAGTFKYLPPDFADSLRNLQVKIRRPLSGYRVGGHKSTAYGSSVEFADYREYTQNDPINLIDWAVYARTDKYMIRQYEEEVSIYGYVMLDVSESLSFQGEGDMSKLDYARYLAAGLMFILVNQQDAAGLVTFDDDVRDRHQPASSLMTLAPQLQALESVSGKGKSDIEGVMHKAADLFRPQSLVILISDLLEPAPNIIRGISHLNHLGHEVMVLHVLDNAELHLRLDSFTELRELETGRRMMINPDEIRDAYSQAVERHINELQRGCGALGADYGLVDTSTPVSEALYSRTLTI